MSPHSKTVLVLDTAAENSGALSVLKEFLQAARYEKSVNWIFVVGTPCLDDSDNVKVLRFPATKKSWLHRIVFDWFAAPRLVRNHKPDCVFSLQNIGISNCPVPQVIFIHQSIPFCQKKFSILNEPRLWIYQNIISRLIFKSAKEAVKIIVQTRWMKDSVAEKTGCSREKIAVIPPDVRFPANIKFECSAGNFRNFFYPANPLIYKNHDIILRASKILKAKGLSNFSITLTVDPGSAIAEKFARAGIKVNALGMVPRDKMCELYSKSVMVFPSYIESFGYPLLEARILQAPILASDLPFSREILDSYGNARFFNPDKPEELAGQMEECIRGNFRYIQVNGSISTCRKGWKEAIKLIKES